MTHASPNDNLMAQTPREHLRTRRRTGRGALAAALGRAALALPLLIAPLAICGCDSSTKVKDSGGPRKESRPGEAQRLARLGEEALKKGDFARAAEYCRSAIQENPEIPGAWNNMGVALLEQQNYVDAAQALRRAAELSPTDPTPYENLGLLYYRAGYDSDAMNAYTNSLERDANWLPSLRGAIVCAQRLNVSDEATQERIRNALMQETDPKWRELFERQRLRVDSEIAERKKKSADILR